MENKMSFRDFIRKTLPIKNSLSNWISPEVYPKLKGSRIDRPLYLIKTNFIIYGIQGNPIKGVLIRNERSSNRFVFLVRSDRGYTFYLNIYYNQIVEMKKLRNANI